MNLFSACIYYEGSTANYIVLNSFFSWKLSTSSTGAWGVSLTYSKDCFLKGGFWWCSSFTWFMLELSGLLRLGNSSLISSS